MATDAQQKEAADTASQLPARCAMAVVMPVLMRLIDLTPSKLRRLTELTRLYAAAKDRDERNKIADVASEIFFRGFSSEEGE